MKNRRLITFMPTGYDGRALRPVTGFETVFGLVAHPTLSTFRNPTIYFDVSDPITGAVVARGNRPGFRGAVLALRLMDKILGPGISGGFKHRLEIARKKNAEKIARMVGGEH